MQTDHMDLPDDLPKEFRSTNRPLVVAGGERGVLVGNRSHLGLLEEGKWQVFGWHQIESGAWRAESKMLRWTDFAGDKHEIKLDDPGRMPELFRERIQASIMFTNQYDLDQGIVQIIARRSLSGHEPPKFYAVAGKGVELSDSATARFVVEETERLSREYALDWR